MTILKLANRTGTAGTLAVVLTTFTPTPAAHANGSLKDPPVMQAPLRALPQYYGYNWSGLYAGVSGAYSFTNVDHYYGRNNGKDDHGRVWLDASGSAFALHIGYQWQMPSQWVFGVEGELGQLNIDRERIVIKNDDVLRSKTGMFGTLRARFGYAFGNFLPYVTAGFAFVDVENAGGNPANANRFLTISETRTGYALGAGAEYAFTPNIVARLEYLFIDTPQFAVRNLENEIMRFDNDYHLVRAGLSWKF